MVSHPGIHVHASYAYHHVLTHSAEADVKFAELSEYTARCEAALNVHLKGGTLPDLALVEAIATAKVLLPMID